MCLNRFQKWKTLSFFPSLLFRPSPSLLSPSPFFFFPRGPKVPPPAQPSPSPRPSATPHFSFPLSHRQAGPARQAFLLPPPVCATDSAESGRRPSSALRLGAHAKGLGPGLYKAPAPPWNPIDPKSPHPPRQTLAPPPPLELGAPRRAAVPPSPLDDFTYMELHVMVKMLAGPSPTPFSPSVPLRIARRSTRSALAVERPHPVSVPPSRAPN